MLNVEQAIAKYSGGDDAYALKLKTGIRDAMGYSNYMAKLKGAVEAPINTGDVSKMDPATMAANRNSAMKVNQGQIDTNEKIVGTIDSTAGSLAEAQVAREKAAAKEKENTIGLQNGVAFAPKNELEQKILEYEQNPKNPDGSVKSLQQFQSEMNDYFKANPTTDMVSTNPDGSMKMRDILTPEQINETIAQKVPKDFIGNEGKYMFMSQGYSEKTAKDASDLLVYSDPKTSDAVKLILQTKNPELAKEFEQSGTINDLIKDSTATKEDGTPAKSYSQLQEEYSGKLTPAQIDKYAKPVYAKNASEDIDTYMNDKINGVAKIDAFSEAYKNGANDKLGLDAVQSTNHYSELKKYLETRYQGALSSPEIDAMINNYILNYSNAHQ